MTSVPIPGNQSSFETLHLFDTWHYQISVKFFFYCDFYQKRMRSAAIIFPYLATFITARKNKT